MKRRLSLVLACMMALVLVLTTAPALAEKTVVNYWSNDRHDEVYMTAMIEKFNAEHDDIEIKMTIMTDDFENSILLAYQGGTAPDLVQQKRFGWSILVLAAALCRNISLFRPLDCASCPAISIQTWCMACILTMKTNPRF